MTFGPVANSKEQTRVGSGQRCSRVTVGWTDAGGDVVDVPDHMRRCVIIKAGV